ncbi:MAG TPA: prephenate dehydrogenase [Candidatus Acidoferrales bacterium]|nr:prephenate dehydrogenase [Candidatus Acidoferrales bacterium]
MSDAGEFRRVAILGAGLIGASFGAAIEKAQPGASIVVYDRPEVLRRLHQNKFRWESSADVGDTVRGADLVYIALPVAVAMEVLSEISPHCDSQALVTDSGSTKVRLCKAAQAAFGAGAKFLGGHPIAGRELSGLEHADAGLFHGKRYVLINNGPASETLNDLRVRRFAELLQAIGADPFWCDAETHDWAMAVVSQMPQLVSVALARVISDETDEAGLPATLAGSGLRDILRTAGSPYEMWRDICMTNTENIARSLDRVAQAVDFLRAHLTSRELEDEFRGANQLYKTLHEKQLLNDELQQSEPLGGASASG